MADFVIAGPYSASYPARGPQVTIATALGDRDEQQDRGAALLLGDAQVLVVADGIGGHPLGAEAAQAAVDAVISVGRRRRKALLTYDRPKVLAVVERMIDDATRAVELVGAGFSRRVPGCTLTIAVRLRSAVAIGHVGDLWWSVDRRQRTTQHGVGRILDSSLPIVTRLDLSWLTIDPRARLTVATDGVSADDCYGLDQSDAESLIRHQIARQAAPQDNALAIVSRGMDGRQGLLLPVEVTHG